MKEKNMNPEVVCIGQAVVDCITRGCAENPHKKNVFQADHIALGTGGDAVNESVMLARMGHRVRLVCGLGQDMAGRLVLDQVTQNGIDTDFITVDGQICTPIANLMVNQDGSRSSINSPASMLGEYKPPTEAVHGSKVVSFASLFRAPLDRREVVVDLIRAAKAEGAIVCADTKLPTYREIHLRDLTEVLSLIDYIFPNEDEAAYYTGKDDFMEMAEWIHRLGVHNVIIKTGPRGCVACGEAGKFTMASRAAEAIDSSGAGDSFVAGFISGLLKGENFYDCCESGMISAAECVQRIGTT